MEWIHSIIRLAENDDNICTFGCGQEEEIIFCNCMNNVIVIMCELYIILAAVVIVVDDVVAVVDCCCFSFSFYCFCYW